MMRNLLENYWLQLEKKERERKNAKEKKGKEKKNAKEEQIRAFELQKLQLESMVTRAQPVEITQLPEQPLKIRIHDIMP
ncbi:hypothetical protein X975_24957, partial [Stegodyphus mimosarum]